MVDTKNMLRRKDACKYIGVAISTLCNWERKGILLPTYKHPITLNTFYSQDDLDNFINKNNGGD